MIGTYLVDDVTLNMDKGMDEWQTPEAAEDVSLKGYIEYKESRIQNNEGELVVSMASVLMKDRTIIVTGFATRVAGTISYKDTLTFDGVAHAIVRIAKLRDFSTRGMKVYVK